jgi:hypothetical protein
MYNWTERNTRMPWWTNFPKIKTALKILGVENDMKQVPHSGPTNIRCPQTKRHTGDLALGICVVLQKQFLPLLLGWLYTITICQKVVHHYASKLFMTDFSSWHVHNDSKLWTLSHNTIITPMFQLLVIAISRSTIMQRSTRCSVISGTRKW